MVSAVSSSQPVTLKAGHPARIRVFYAAIKRVNFPTIKGYFLTPTRAHARLKVFFQSLRARADITDGGDSNVTRKSAGSLLVSYNTDISQQEAVDQASASQTRTPTTRTARPATTRTPNDSDLFVLGDW